MSKPPPTDTGACGESRGYQRHRKRGEQACGPCLAAHSLDVVRRKHDPCPDPRPSMHEIAAEIDHLLYMRQGTGYILKAVNRSPIYLTRSLYQIGRPDLARLFNLENAA